jgi:FlaA1/EpsC-like NDP-sugar epimerase
VPALVEPRVADVTDDRRLRRLLEELRAERALPRRGPQARALMEANPGEAIKNNVAGTRLLADLADELGVETLRARLERQGREPHVDHGGQQARSPSCTSRRSPSKSRTRFVAVRFGNVLASSGSVVPMFLEQIARGGPLTVTHPEAAASS